MPLPIIGNWLWDAVMTISADLIALGRSCTLMPLPRYGLAKSCALSSERLATVIDKGVSLKIYCSAREIISPVPTNRILD